MLLVRDSLPPLFPSLTVPLADATALLGQTWEAQVEWKDLVKNQTFFIKDVTDMTQSSEKIVISAPLVDDVTILFDYNTYDVIVEETGRLVFRLQSK